jgi:membrane protein DedA with SNARE-associated domain
MDRRARADGAGSLVWNAALIFAGQQLGSHWEDVGDALAPVAQWVLVTIVPLLIVGLLVRRHRKRRRAAPPPPPPGG